MVKTLHTFSIKHLYLFLLISTGSVLYGQAPVDNPCNLPAPAGAEWPLSGACISMNTNGMTALYNPATCSSGARDDAWAWVTGDGNNLTITYNPTSDDAVLHVFSAVAPCAVTEIDCANAGGSGVSETVNVTPSVLGQVYFIRVQRRNSNNNMAGNLCVTSTAPPAGGSGDDCANAIRVDCGDPILVAETTIGNADTENGWSCTALTTNGEDRFYVVQWPDAVNGGSIRLDFTNVVDDDTYMEVMSLGSTCSPNTCTNSSQFTVLLGTFGIGGNTFIEYTVGPGVTDYYFVIDSQGNGVTSYDMEVTCFATGIKLDVNSGCAPIPVGAAANQGYYVTWDGAAPPATVDAAVLAASNSHTICENIYLENVGWEWFKYFDIILGECWLSPTALTPDTPPMNNGFFNGAGEWTASVVPGGAGPDTLRWSFVNSLNPTWGDGSTNNYNCNLYTFCYTADADAACVINNGFQNGVSASDDGIGGGGGGSVNPGNVTVTSTGPTVLPVTLLSFTAKVVLNEEQYGVVLNWRTESEINNDYFTIERSLDGRNFEEVLTVPGAGNSNSINNYFSVDEDPFTGVSYYRLRQTDFDGKVEFFDIVTVSVKANIDGISVYPNPVTNNGHLTFNADRDGQFEVTIYDVTGRKVLFEKYSVEEGANNIEMPTSNLKQGMYFIYIGNDTEQTNIKFVKE